MVNVRTDKNDESTKNVYFVYRICNAFVCALCARTYFVLALLCFVRCVSLTGQQQQVHYARPFFTVVWKRERAFVSMLQTECRANNNSQSWYRGRQRAFHYHIYCHVKGVPRFFHSLWPCGVRLLCAKNTVFSVLSSKLSVAFAEIRVNMTVCIVRCQRKKAPPWTNIHFDLSVWVCWAQFLFTVNWSHRRFQLHCHVWQTGRAVLIGFRKHGEAEGKSVRSYMVFTIAVGWRFDTQPAQCSPNASPQSPQGGWE